MKTRWNFDLLQINFLPSFFYSSFICYSIMFVWYIYNICLILVAGLFVKSFLFQEALQFKKTIILCYNKQNTINISDKVPFLFT
jgi:hypothetical protein